MKRKVICVLLAGVLTAGMTACSWSKDAVKTTAGSSVTAADSNEDKKTTADSSGEDVTAGSASSSAGTAAEEIVRSDSKETVAGTSAQGEELNLAGNAEEGAAEKLAGAFDLCVGWGGSAGSALRSAAAAEALVEWAAEYAGSAEETEASVKQAWDKFDEDTKSNFKENWRGIRSNGDCMFSDFESVKGVLGDSGVLEKATEAVAKENAQQKWETLRDCVESGM
uniref:hypothetical protein n=1 Tax=Eubacterium cellulosolvens TaxID=29322 RepID=UPI00048259D9|nr:hypothetical protein [[Eubacterium] cellulosolvens]